MKALKYFAMLAVLTVPLALAQAQVGVGIGIGVGPGYVAGPPVCDYGYYPYAPYACAPYGYYGATWFANGIFIGAGPWYHGWGRPFYPGYGYYRGPIARGYVGRGYEGRGYTGRGSEGRRVEHGPVRGYPGSAPRVGSEGRISGGEFHGSSGSRGGRR